MIGGDLPDQPLPPWLFEDALEDDEINRRELDKEERDDEERWRRQEAQLDEILRKRAERKGVKK